MENTATSKVNKTIKFTPLNLKKEYDVNEKKDTAVLSWGIRNGYPRISVNLSGIRTETVDYSKLITAPFDYIAFGRFLQIMKDVIAGPNGVTRKVECLNVKWNNGVKTDEIYVQATANFGKDANGVFFLAVIEDKKIKVKFDLLPAATWHRFYDDKGNLIEDKGILSLSFTEAYVSALEKLMDSELMHDGKYKLEKISGVNSVRPSNTTSTGDSVATIVPDEKKVESSSDINIDDLF